MNTGICDAVNIAWKLADVIKARVDPIDPPHLRDGAHRLGPPARRHHRPTTTCCAHATGSCTPSAHLTPTSPSSPTQSTPPVHTVTWNAAAADAGFPPDTTHLIRPDGDIALAATDDATTVLRDLSEQWRLDLRPGWTAAPSC